MRTIILFTLVAFTVAEVDYYKVDDHFDIDPLIANRPALQAFLDCFKGTAPCNEVTAVYKKNIRDAVETKCLRCSPNHKYIFWRFLQGVKEYSPDEYWNFRHTFDPDNKYFDALEQDISRYVKPDMKLIVN